MLEGDEAYWCWNRWSNIGHWLGQMTQNYGQSMSRIWFKYSLPVIYVWTECESWRRYNMEQH